MSEASDATRRVVAARPPYLVERLQSDLENNRSLIFIQLCGAHMSATEAELLITLAEEGLKRHFSQQQA